MAVYEGTPAEEIELLQSMQARLSEFLQEKASAQKQVAAMDERLQEGFKALGQRPRETEEEIEKTWKAMEYNRTTRTMSLNEEKKVLRQIDDLKKQKVRVRTYKAQEEELQALKRTRNATYDSIKVMDSTITELNQAIRKLQLAQRVGVPSDSLVTVSVSVPEEFMSRVIGKGGSNLRKLEEACRVSVDMKHTSQTAEISGGIEGCEMARLEIEKITSSVTEDIPVSEAMVQTLLVQKAARAMQLMNQHDVRLEVLKSESAVRVSGLPHHVAELRAALAEIRVGTERVPVDTRLIAAVVGRGGANFRKIEEEYSVAIDVDRSETSGAILVRGPTDQLVLAAEEIRQLIETYEEREEKVEVDRFKARLLMEDQGRLMKDVRKSTGCLLHIDLKKEAEDGFIIVKGQAYKLAEGVEAVRRLLAQVEEHTIMVPVDQEMMRFVIGKKGAVINKLRQATGASLDTDMKNAVVRIYSEDDEKRNKAREEVLGVIEKNQVSDVTICRESAICLKGAKGAELREKCANELEVQLDIDADHGHIALRGSVEAMAQAKILLLEFGEANFGVDMDLPTDDFMTLVAGGEESLKKKIQDETGAALITVKDKENEGEGVLRIRGPREAVLRAEEAVRKALDGEDDGSGALLPVHPDALPALIGKAGATINKFRDDHGVQLIVLKVRKAVRIRGEPEKVAAAKEALSKYMAELRVTLTVHASKAQQDALESRSKRELQAIGGGHSYDVSVDRTNDGFRLRGLIAEVMAARTRLNELLSGRSKLSVSLTPSQLSALQANGCGEGNWRRIREDFGVSVELDKLAGAVVIQGAVQAVSRAKDQLFQVLEVLLAGQFAHVDVPPESLPGLARTSTLNELSLHSGIDQDGILIDREKSVVRLRGTPEQARKGVEAVAAYVARWSECHVTVPFDAWMLPLLIGKQGANIKEIEKATGVTVDIDREGGQAAQQGGIATLRLSSEDPEAVKRAKETVTEQLEAIKKEYAEMEVPHEVVPALIGKKGANLAKIREETGATIDVLSDSKEKGEKGDRGHAHTHAPGGMVTVRIRGNEETVAKTRIVIEDFVSEWQKHNTQTEVAVHPDQFRLIVGRTGSTVRLIQEESGAKLDMDRERSIVVIRGSDEAVEKARVMVQRIIDDDNAANAAARAEADRLRKEKKEEAALHAQQTQQAADTAAAAAAQNNAHGHEWSFPKVPPGADPAMAKQLLQRAAASESKTSKKKKKKQDKAGAHQPAAAKAAEPHAVSPKTASHPPTAANGHAAIGDVKTTHREKTASPATKAASPARPANAKQERGRSPSPVPAPRLEDVSHLVQTEGASELLSLILGGPIAATGKGAGKGPNGSASHDGGEGEEGKYYKSATGLSVRL